MAYPILAPVICNMSRREAESIPLTLPVGTQIVSRIAVRPAGTQTLPRGAVGVIVQAPADQQHAYWVRFAAGTEAALRRSQFTIRKHFHQDDSLQREESRDFDELCQYVIYRCVVGSRAYGLDDEGSDIDRRGIYLPPAEVHWSLAGAPEQLENAATEECYWELQKFLNLALKANPTVLECLYSPLVETITPIAEELLAMRDCFLSRLIYQTYNGYVMSQFKRLEQDLRNRGELKWKHAMHLIRLLLSGIAALRESSVQVSVGEQRERLLAIRRGLVEWTEVNEWRLRLHREFDAAYAGTRLPERPDIARVNAFLVRARRAMV
jgi:uncharacterized protein